MGLYEEIKEIAKRIKKEGNTELYSQLIDLSSVALDMQSEIVSLNAEISELRKSKDINDSIQRHSETYITIEDTTDSILYCSRCWDLEDKLVQVKCFDSGIFKCTHCENGGTYDKEKRDIHSQNQRQMNRNMANKNNRRIF